MITHWMLIDCLQITHGIDWVSSNISFPKIKLSMPGTFYVPLPRIRPIARINCEAPDTTHRESIGMARVEKKRYVYILIKLEALLEDHLVQTITGLVLIDYSRRGYSEKVVRGFSGFDDVKIMLSHLEQM